MLRAWEVDCAKLELIPKVANATRKLNKVRAELKVWPNK
jgi:hypothetical protein